MNPVRIVLSGVAINTVLMGFTTLLQLIYSDSLSGVLAFLNGSISASTWYDVRLILAKALQAKFNVPYLELNFYGYQACLNSSEQIAKLLELNI
ncbi:iron chelate uptake ABC transporter family permease subunit [Amygdalobacter nucleatus]|uniref:iron chelate uptake ABC transporter family permease subunit n=1 Tax=Amygdalobacter nucleatus TaxID=3029274 RepID=UPI0027A44C5D|nr:iron chelate uptake ABC transporter family permease subunit [Amygdalobacter nucleatus]WEG37092.1 iron chelate uptake ABC transporter family permease subunit [Amygdalobacter nucleatus]